MTRKVYELERKPHPPRGGRNGRHAIMSSIRDAYNSDPRREKKNRRRKGKLETTPSKEDDHIHPPVVQE